MKLQGTYVQVPDALMQSDLTPAEKLVYISLLHFAGDDGTCWPSVHTIATFCHVDDRTVQRSILTLRAKKWITEKRMSHVKSCFYRLSTPHIRHSATGGNLPPMNNEPTKQVSLPKGDILPPSWVTFCHPGGDILPPELIFNELKEEREIYKEKEKGCPNMSGPQNLDSLPDVLPGFAEGKPREQKCKKGILPEVKEVLAYLNEKIGTRYSVSPDLTARIHAGASVAQAEQIIDKKVAEWQGTEMARYLRPSTLFCAKHFDEYLNQPVTVPLGSRHVNASWPSSAYGHGEDLDPEIKALDDMEGDDL